MCGRFAQRKPSKVIAKTFNVEVPELEPRFNLAPTQDVLVVRENSDGREAVLLKWGLIPSWARDPSKGVGLFNARCETVAEKPSFRDSFRRRRCLIPADGFYEWRRAGSAKRPYFFEMRDESPFAFAGLWERWEREGEAIETCAILTTTANETVAPIHDRMPVILDSEDSALWLDEDLRTLSQKKGLLRPYPASAMISRPVSALVNSPRNQGAGLVEGLKVNPA
jgi:putative SOS response-associated peptidase YedK